MSQPPSRYTEHQIFSLFTHEATRHQAEICIKNESSTRIALMKECFAASQTRAEAEKCWKQVNATAVNEATVAAIRAEAKMRVSEEKMLGKLKGFWEEEVRYEKSMAVENEGRVRVECLEREIEERTRREGEECEARMRREDRESGIWAAR